MSYAIAQPPYTLKFKQMTKAELAGFYAWFFDVMPERSRQLTSAVRDVEAYADWTPETSPDSLNSLGSWFADQVATRARTIQEMNELSFGSTMNIEPPDWELTNRTFSLAMDVGMHLSGVMLARHPKLSWMQPLDDPEFVDYGRPVLTGFGGTILNPVRVCVTLAYAIAAKERDGGRLRQLFDFWSKRASKAGTQAGSRAAD